MEITDMLARALDRTIAFLPNLLAAIVILAIGLLIAAGLGKLTERGLSALALHRRHAVRQMVEHDESLVRVPKIGGKIIYWLVAIVTIGLAIDALRLSWLSAGVAQVLAYLPSALAAAAIVAVGYFIGNFLYRRIARSETGSLLWGRIARVAVLVVAGFMAIQELGIATAIVTTAFTLLLGAVAVAAAIAFGWGNRELAGRITQDWYERRGTRYRMREPSELRRPEDEFFHEERTEPRH